MSEPTGREREELALDALLISALRRKDQDAEEVEPKRLPKLSAEETAAMNALGPDFVEKLLAGHRPAVPETNPPPVAGGNALAGGGLHFAMNRAEEVDDETTEELQRRKREILERKEQERKENGDARA